jgi:sigma-E factor negative regulatory protein RseC
MIKEIGRVIKKTEQIIWVETEIKSTCSSCAAKANCGTSSIAQAFAGKSVVNEVHDHIGVAEGDIVEIGIPEESLVRGASTMYLIPLLFGLIGAMLSQFVLALPEGMTILATGLFAWLGFAFTAKKLKQQEHDFEPKLLKLIEQNISIHEIP